MADVGQCRPYNLRHDPLLVAYCLLFRGDAGSRICEAAAIIFPNIMSTDRFPGKPRQANHLPSF